MARPEGPGETGKTSTGKNGEPGIGDDELGRRRLQLEKALSSRRPASKADDGESGKPTTGYGQALKLSSEFIAGIVVGAGLGWFIDRMAGTSPWGLIVFLFLGFGAGILNVLRAAGRVAEFGEARSVDKTDRSGKT